MISIVNFRTMSNGSFKYMRSGQRRGWWRVLTVIDPKGSTAATSRNVVSVDYSGPDGIDGVTERSCYYIEGSRQRAIELAAALNAQRAGY